MRILMITLHARLIGGLETYCRDVALALRDQGHTVEVITALEPTRPAAGWDTIPIHGIAPANHTLFRLYMRIWPLWLTLYLYFAYRRTHYDKVLVMHPLTAYPAYRAGIRNYDAWTYGVDVWGEWSNRLTIGLKNAAQLITISQHTRSILVDHFPGREVSIIYPIVDIERFVPPETPRQSPPYVLLTVARLVKSDVDKGHEKIIRNLKAIQARTHLELEYWIAGDGPDRSRLEQLARECGVTEQVKFLGRVPDDKLVVTYQNCDVFIMPSIREGFGIVYLEASACAKPVIGSIVGGAADAVENGLTGLCIDPQSDAMLVDAAAQILLNPDYAQQLGRAGRLRVEQNFSRASLLRALGQLFEQD